METICLQCGDKGFPDAFVFCVICLDVAVHRYCLNVISFDEFVRWVCNDCEGEVQVQNQPALRQTTDFDERKRSESSSSEHLHEGELKNDNLMEHDKLLSDTLLQEITRKKRSAIKKRPNEKFLIIERVKLASDSMLSMEVKENKFFESELQCSETSNLCEEFSKDSFISSTVDCHMYDGPVIAPIWRGCFNIWNKNHNILDGLMAHMSTKACQKLYKAASQFGPVLHLEMLPKSVVWGKSSESSEPSSENIALYFFPSDLRSERVFDHLVEEMVLEEVAMRAVLENAELLIFTSTELPMPYWSNFRADLRTSITYGEVLRGEKHYNICSELCGGESRDSPIILLDLDSESALNIEDIVCTSDNFESRVYIYIFTRLYIAPPLLAMFVLVLDFGDLNAKKQSPEFGA